MNDLHILCILDFLSYAPPLPYQWLTLDFLDPIGLKYVEMSHGICYATKDHFAICYLYISLSF